MYEYKLNRLPSSFNNSWILNRDTDPHYMLRNGEDFAIPRLNHQYLKSHPLFYFPNLWNTFKPVFKNSIVSRSTFSSNLKSFFLHKLDANYSIDCKCFFCTVQFARSQGLSTQCSYILLFYLLFSRFTKALMVGPTQNPNTNIHLSFLFILFIKYHTLSNNPKS